ncbi:MAG: hypothetical protein U0V73_09400 [Acidimicrobiia bacterium]
MIFARRFVFLMVFVFSMLGLAANMAGAASNPSGTGQPGADCETSSAAPNGFGTQGFANAQARYAGSAPQNSNNPKSVSQYDVACDQLSQH